MSRAAVERRRPRPVAGQPTARTRRRRAWALIVGAPLALFLAAYLCAGGPVLSWWPPLAGGGLAAVLGTVSAIARWSARRDARKVNR